MSLFDPDLPLIEIRNKTQNDAWTIRNAFEGVQIFGGIGSGKTSGSGRFLALKYLKAGFGGLVLTVKPDERDEWVKYCHATNRDHDLIIVSPRNENYFNILDFETEQSASEQNVTENLVDVLKTVITASSEKDKGKSDDAFWETALDMLLFNVIDLCKFAYGNITVQRMYDIVQSIPKGAEQGKSENDGKAKHKGAYDKAMDRVNEIVREKLELWEEQYKEELEKLSDPGEYDELAMDKLPIYRQFKYITQFFEESFIPLSEKTRSIIEFSFSGFLFRLLRDPVYKLFYSQKSTFSPNDCLSGKIIILDLPVKKYDKIGRDAQIMFKYVWQRAMEKRNVKIIDRPVFLWADEAQNFLHEHDADYQATARSSRICTVYISQNLPNYYANMGGQKSDHRIKSFLGTLNTKIFHANADIETNKYASELIGESLFESQTETSVVGSNSTSKSFTKSMASEKTVKPEAFVGLRTGSTLNNGIVDGYIHLQGNTLSNGRNHLKMSFDQNYKPT